MKKAKKASSPDLPEDVARLRGWRRARPVAGIKRMKPPARRITINIDEDVIAIFQAEALRGGPPYQIAINQALREHLRNRERTEHERAVELVMKALDDEAVIEKLRLIH